MDATAALARVGLTLEDDTLKRASLASAVDVTRQRRPEDKLLQEAIDAFLDSILARNRSPETLRCYITPMRLFGAWMSVRYPGAICADLTPAIMDAFVYYLRHEHKNTRRGGGLGDYTVLQYARVVKIMVAWGSKGKRYWSSFPLADYELPTYVEKEIVILTEQEQKALLAAAGSQSSFMGRRLRAMLLVALDTGMRPSEVRRMTIDMLDQTSGRIRLPGWLTKTRRGRTVHIQGETLNAVRVWLAARSVLPNSDPDSGPLFCQLHGGEISDRAMSELAVRLGARSGVRRFHWHLMRHTAGTESLRHGADSLDVQEMLGHTTSFMTKRYLHLTDDDRQQRHARYSPVQALMGKNEPRQHRFQRRP